ncbi:TonB-dependent receptor [Pedobacter sp. ISL-68]|uniref:TonB-dependent receptor n=1 Tax=unclassified Pedobacter TaxID=2628915 RepID=UPI001BEC093E|nr:MULTISPECIES: TonB-dependent receptor [unclassified Pedobacter]MBT2563123.1 TonB-dependent receptor [Pedobacter sp. ISL-64]MBT2593461.1 TonB-dependent receptor [Pedobacter sp. ISL-68]
MKFYDSNSYRASYANEKILLIMKLTTILLFALIFQVHASGYAQKNVTVDERNASLEKVLEKIGEQSGYDIFFNAKLIEKANLISIKVTDMPLLEVLVKCFANQPLTYTVEGSAIIIREKKITNSDIESRKANYPMLNSTKGRVVDENGAGLPGVSVIIKGTSKGNSTNNTGNFTIETAPGDILVISAIGYESKEIAVNGVSDLGNITLRQKPQALDELVVIGYGKVSRKNISGAVATIKGSDLASVSTSSNLAQSLQGKAAGLQVLQGTGQPGANAIVKIRNNPSNASAGVLYVVDGVPINGGAGVPASAVSTQGNQDISSLNFINPNDIESIEVLKDAASASIYGARAGAGVILITTKRGQSGAPKINYTGSYAWQNAAKMYEVLGTKDYMEQVNLIDLERWMQSNKVAPYYGTVNGSALTPFKPRFTQQDITNSPNYPNAMDAVAQKGYTTQHDVSVSGGSENSKYFISGNYFDQKGILIATGMQRYNFRANFDQNITKKIKMGISAAMSSGKITATGTGGANEAGGILTAALYYPANMSLVNPDGTFPLNPRYANIPNPLSYATVTNNINSFRLLTNAYLSWEIIDGLTAKGMYSYDRSTNEREMYLPRTYLGGAKTSGSGNIAQAAAGIKLLEYTLNYDKTFAIDHRISAVAGYSFNQFNTSALSAGNQNFPTDALLYHNLSTGQSPKPSVGSGSSEKVIASYFARGVYTYKNRYTLQASVRRDGASNFATNKKWGYFPGVAANWIMSEEGFMKESHTPISFIKLRLSYGETGNSDIQSAAQLAYNTTFSGGNYSYLFGDGSSSSTGFGIARLDNPNLSWETAKEINAGLDFGLFHDRITGSFDYFTKTISGLLFNVTTPGNYEVGVQTVNAGKTRTDGYDIALQSKNFIDRSGNKGFTWSTSVNFSHYLSYWTERAPQTLATLSKYVAVTGKDAVTNGAYGYISSGIYKGNGSVPNQMPGLLPGSLIIQDLAGYDANGNLAAADGKITEADQTLLANFDPKFNFGIGNRFTFKNFDLNIYFSGAVLKAWSPYAPNLNFRVASLAANMGTFGWNTMPISLERWTFQNPDGNFPTGLSDSKYATYQNNSSYWIVDASFLRCRNITLGYAIPSAWLARQKVIKGARLSFDVQNPFTITNYPGLDPELNQNNYYPLAKSYVLGIDFNF